MALKLYSHPLASFCWKALIALYENDVAFDPVLVDFADEASSAAFRAAWPLAKMPVLRDEERGQTVAESTVVIEYLDMHYPGPVRLVPDDPDLAWQARMWDRIYDNYVQATMQVIVNNQLRPQDRRDDFGAEAARGQLQGVYRFLESQLAARTWAAGDVFTLADCAAAPALFYAGTLVPFADGQINLRAYFERLASRPSVARVLVEAEPYFHMFPFEAKPRIPAAALQK